jgi:hypothetical protein
MSRSIGPSCAVFDDLEAVRFVVELGKTFDRTLSGRVLPSVQDPAGVLPGGKLFLQGEKPCPNT